MALTDYDGLRRKHRREAYIAMGAMTAGVIVAIGLCVTNPRYCIEYVSLMAVGGVIVGGLQRWAQETLLADAANPAMYERYKRLDPDGPIFALLDRRFGRG